MTSFMYTIIQYKVQAVLVLVLPRTQCSGSRANKFANSFNRVHRYKRKTKRIPHLICTNCAVVVTHVSTVGIRPGLRALLPAFLKTGWTFRAVSPVEILPDSWPSWGAWQSPPKAPRVTTLEGLLRLVGPERNNQLRFFFMTLVQTTKFWSIGISKRF